MISDYKSNSLKHPRTPARDHSATPEGAHLVTLLFSGCFWNYSICCYDMEMTMLRWPGLALCQAGEGKFKALEILFPSFEFPWAKLAMTQALIQILTFPFYYKNFPAFPSQVRCRFLLQYDLCDPEKLPNEKPGLMNKIGWALTAEDPRDLLTRILQNWQQSS